MRTITLNDQQSAAAHAGQLARVVVPLVKRWYPDGAYIDLDDTDEHTGRLMYADECGDYHLVPCPLGEPGEIVGVKEAWAYAWSDEYLYQQQLSAVIYRASWQDGDPEPLCGLKWRPARSMPAWAIRTRLRVLAVECKRVRDIAPREWLQVFGETAQDLERRQASSGWLADVEFEADVWCRKRKLTAESWVWSVAVEKVA